MWHHDWKCRAEQRRVWALERSQGLTCYTVTLLLVNVEILKEEGSEEVRMAKKNSLHRTRILSGGNFNDTLESMSNWTTVGNVQKSHCWPLFQLFLVSCFSWSYLSHFITHCWYFVPPWQSLTRRCWCQWLPLRSQSRTPSGMHYKQDPVSL